MDEYFGSVAVVRLVLQRGLAAIYLVAFVSALNQFPALLGDDGLLPVKRYVERTRFRDGPSLFRLHYSDRLFRFVAWSGIVLSLLALSGLSERGSVWLSAAVWLLLWAFYQSIVNVGQTFYAFGWESMLLEAGFFAIFLGPSGAEPSLVPILALRFMLLRVELGAGLIKLRHDECWRKLTCLYWHHETQPLPNPLSIHFHRLPKALLRFGVLFSHFVQLVVPFGLLLPQPVSSIAGVVIVVHQGWLIVSGNYSWLNWLTVVLAVTAFSDEVLRTLIPIAVPAQAPRGTAHDVVLWLLGGATLVLGVAPVKNLFSKHQRMNQSYNPLHVVNSYGAFGSVTKIRHEVVLEATLDEAPDGDAVWREYEHHAKPGPLDRLPSQVAPYHLRLDWLMWFLPFGVRTHGERVLVPGYDRWFLRLVEKLLRADAPTLRLLRRAPFAQRPRFVRARYYRYEFADRQTQRTTGALWKRRLIGDYLSPTDLSDFRIEALDAE
ncbi:MAG TPA: lipase maturation factor family protein [Polyangiaceae bacterium]